MESDDIGLFWLTYFLVSTMFWLGVAAKTVLVTLRKKHIKREADFLYTAETITHNFSFAFLWLFFSAMFLLQYVADNIALVALGALWIVICGIIGIFIQKRLFMKIISGLSAIFPLGRPGMGNMAWDAQLLWACFISIMLLLAAWLCFIARVFFIRMRKDRTRSEIIIYQKTARLCIYFNGALLLLFVASALLLSAFNPITWILCICVSISGLLGVKFLKQRYLKVLSAVTAIMPLATNIWLFIWAAKHF